MCTNKECRKYLHANVREGVEGWKSEWKLGGKQSRWR
jgi:hypothetical protein